MPLLPDLVDALAAADEFPALARVADMLTAICKAPEPIALSVRRHVHRQPRGALEALRGAKSRRIHRARADRENVPDRLAVPPE
jgi:hypothetical protein